MEMCQVLAVSVWSSVLEEFNRTENIGTVHRQETITADCFLSCCLTDPHKKPELVAPAQNVPVINNEGTWSVVDGTSAATVYVTGAIALLLQRTRADENNLLNEFRTNQRLD